MHWGAGRCSNVIRLDRGSIGYNLVQLRADLGLKYVECGRRQVLSSGVCCSPAPQDHSVICLLAFSDRYGRI